MNLLITEVTEMQRDNYCVAGWCYETQRMVRTLPGGAHWRASLLEKHGIVPGVTIRVSVREQPQANAYPHRTEDEVIYKNSIRCASAAPAQWFSPDAPPAAATLEDAFKGHLRYNREWKGARAGVHVAAGVKARSLWAVSIRRDTLSFKEESFEDSPKKLKAVFSDGQAQYDLAVTSRALKEMWRADGLAGVNALFPNHDILYQKS